MPDRTEPAEDLGDEAKRNLACNPDADLTSLPELLDAWGVLRDSALEGPVLRSQR